MRNKGCLLAGLVGLGVLAFLALVMVLFVWGRYNGMVRNDEAVNSAWAQVETVLQRRYDLIPNLVNTVKGFAKQESSVLEEVTRLRSQWAQAGTVSQKAQAASALEGALGRLMVVVERYPDLKSNQNFLALQDELAGTENRISVERRRCNEAVRQYNTLIRSVPNNLLAGMFGFQRREFFEAQEGAEAVPKVEF